MNDTRNTAMWLGVVGAGVGVIGVVAAVTGDLRIGTIVIGQSREPGLGLWVVALGVIALGIGAAVSQYRPLAAAGIMIVGVLAVLAGEWNETSQWLVDLWTTATGGIVAYVDEQGLAHMPGFGDVLGGSLRMMSYAATALLGTAAAIIAAFAPRPETTERRPAIGPVPV